MKNTISLFLFFTAFISCQNASNINKVETHPIETVSDDIGSKKVEDTIVETNTIYQLPEEISPLDVSNWSINEFIIECPNSYKEELKQYLKFERKEWKNVPNPFIADYDGNEFGDYHHIIFKGGKNKSYDFGFGSNDFGEFELFSDDELIDNPKYVGRTFKVYWEWKAASFPCCSGEYDMVKAYLPSIVRLELVEAK